MNYLQEINKFYDWMETHSPISKNAIGLWYALMHINSSEKWIRSFTTTMDILEKKTGIKRRELFKARNELKNCGLIDWQQKCCKQSAIYTLKSIINIIYAERTEATKAESDKFLICNDLKSKKQKHNHELYTRN